MSTRPTTGPATPTTDDTPFVDQPWCADPGHEGTTCTTEPDTTDGITTWRTATTNPDTGETTRDEIIINASHVAVGIVALGDLINRLQVLHTALARR